MQSVSEMLKCIGLQNFYDKDGKMLQAEFRIKTTRDITKTGNPD